MLARRPALPFWDQDAALARRPPFDALSNTQLKRRCVALARTIEALDPLLVAVTMTAADFDQHVRGGLLIPQQTDPVLEDRRLRALRVGQQPASTLHFGLLPFAERALQRHGRPQGVRLVLEGSEPARDRELSYALRKFVRQVTAPGGHEALESVRYAKPREPAPASRALEAAALVAWAARAELDGRGRNRVARALGAIEIVSVGGELAKSWTDAVNASWATDGIAADGVAAQPRV